jgi:cytochrome c peroxidase
VKHYWLISTTLVASCMAQDPTGTLDSDVRNTLQNNHPFQNDLGTSTTWSTAGGVDLTNDFFGSFGTNGRTCGTCHAPANGWTVAAADVQDRFDRTDGLDPIFRTNDGSVSPDADVSTVDARRAAYAMLLSRGTIRVGIGVPATAEFELVAVDDPYGHASASELSLFRRPLPSANLTLIPLVMWDGRVPGATVHDALSAQADGATLGHAQATGPLSPEANAAVVAFETGLFSAQLVSADAGRLDVDGANGGAEALASDTLVAGRFNLFDGWQNSDIEARRAIYRGQELFNTRRRTNGGGACNGCHTTVNTGTNAKGTMFNIGMADGVHRTSDLPLYTLRNKTTGETIQTTDPGRALITGLWKDVGRFKVPSLRALGARAPYFHNGSAETLTDVVRFYEANVSFSFTEAEESDLVAFLSAL